MWTLESEGFFRIAIKAIFFVLVEKMSWFDSHCHLQGFFEKGTLEEVLARAEELDVSKMTTVGTSPEDWELYRTLAEKYPERIFFSAGLHPSYVDSDWKTQLEGLSDFWSADPKPVALGEIGLDYFRLPKDEDKARETKDFQVLAFKEQLNLAQVLNLPVIVHSRNAFADCVHLIDESGVNWKKVVFHCFSEGVSQIEQLIERGGAASFTGILTFKKNEQLREAALRQGIENLMIETDSPYLAPEPRRGKMNEPAFLHHIGQYAANLFGVPEELLAEKTTARTEEFYGE
jgi:TatD DNase family protein